MNYENNFKMLNKNFKTELKNYFESETKLNKKTIKKNNKNDKSIENIR